MKGGKTNSQMKAVGRNRAKLANQGKVAGSQKMAAGGMVMKGAGAAKTGNKTKGVI